MECVKKIISILTLIFFQSFFSYAAVWDIQTIEEDLKHSFDTNVDLVIDGNSVPHLIYFNRWNNDPLLSLVHCYLSGGGWNKSDVISEYFYCDDEVKYHPKACIDIDANGVLYVAFSKSDDSIYYTSKTSQGWEVPYLIDGTGICLIYDMLVDNNSLLHIVYIRIPPDLNEDDSELVLAVGREFSFSKYIIRENGNFQSSSIAIDSLGNNHIAYYDINSVADHELIKYIISDYNSVSDQAIEEFDGSDTFSWGSISIAIDSNNKPHISYYHITDTNLKYATKPDASWIIETVDNGRLVGEYCSMALDSNNRPHIFYSDTTYGAKMIKYAYRDYAGWNTEKVKDTYEYCKYSSLAMDSSDRPHAFYTIPFERTVEYANEVICGDEKHPYPDADINKNCYVDMYDLALFAQRWTESGCGTPDYCGGTDLDKKGTVDINDLAIIEEDWLDCTMPYCY